jgi:hypothetical protein
VLGSGDEVGDDDVGLDLELLLLLRDGLRGLEELAVDRDHLFRHLLDFVVELLPVRIVDLVDGRVREREELNRTLAVLEEDAAVAVVVRVEEVREESDELRARGRGGEEGRGGGGGGGGGKSGRGWGERGVRRADAALLPHPPLTSTFLGKKNTLVDRHFPCARRRTLMRMTSIAATLRMPVMKKMTTSERLSERSEGSMSAYCAFTPRRSVSANVRSEAFVPPERTLPPACEPARPGALGAAPSALSAEASPRRGELVRFGPMRGDLVLTILTLPPFFAKPVEGSSMEAAIARLPCLAGTSASTPAARAARGVALPSGVDSPPRESLASVPRSSLPSLPSASSELTSPLSSEDEAFAPTPEASRLAGARPASPPAVCACA